MQETKQFFSKQQLDPSVLTRWDCTIPNSDLELWAAGSPVHVVFTDDMNEWRAENNIDYRTMTISAYVTQEYDLGVVQEINKANNDAPTSGLTKRDLFNQMKALAFTSPGPNEYHHAVNRLIAQHDVPTPNHRRIGTKQVKGKPGDIFMKWRPSA